MRHHSYRIMLWRQISLPQRTTLESGDLIIEGQDIGATPEQIFCEREYERDKAICLFLLDSGVRATELCMLDVGDLNTDTGEVKVRVGKGQKDRVTYSGPKTRKQMRRYFLRERDERVSS